MKAVKYLLSLFAAAIVFASCTTTQRVYDDEFDGAVTRRVGDRVYVEDPYYGTVILERNPVTGRYYDVTNGYNRGYYSYPYNGWNNRVYRGYNNRVYSQPNKGTYQRPPQQAQGPREEARRKVLGN